MKIKRLLLPLASTALVLAALSSPAAQANVGLTDPPGTLVPIGAQITFTSTNFKTTIGGNTIECKKLTLHYEVVVNGPTHVVLDPAQTIGGHNGEAKECVTKTPFGSFTNHMANNGSGQITINTWGTGYANFTYTSLTTFVNRHCAYSGAMHIEGLASGTDELEATGSTFTAPEENCGDSVGHGTFTIETSNGVEVRMHFVQTH